MYSDPDTVDEEGDGGLAARVRRLSWPKKLGIGCLGLLVLWIGLGIVLGSLGLGSSSGVAGMSCRTSASGMETCTGNVAFADCLGMIQRSADEFGVAPINIVETRSLRIVRFPASDGSVLMTCSLDGQMNITRSPHSG